jgi:peptidoglycan/LPS O-acetylase OafA/YrhL
LLERYKIVLGGGTVLLGLLALAMALTDQAWLTAAAYLTSTAANGLLLGRRQALVADFAPEPERPRWIAFQGSPWGGAQPVVPALVAVFGSVAGAPGAGAFWTGGPRLPGGTPRPELLLTQRRPHAGLDRRPEGGVQL